MKWRHGLTDNLSKNLSSAIHSMRSPTWTFSLLWISMQSFSPFFHWGQWTLWGRVCSLSLSTPERPTPCFFWRTNLRWVPLCSYLQMQKLFCCSLLNNQVQILTLALKSLAFQIYPISSVLYSSQIELFDFSSTWAVIFLKQPLLFHCHLFQTYIIL